MSTTVQWHVHSQMHTIPIYLLWLCFLLWGHLNSVHIYIYVFPNRFKPHFFICCLGLYVIWGHENKNHVAFCLYAWAKLAPSSYPHISWYSSASRSCENSKSKPSGLFPPHCWPDRVQLTNCSSSRKNAMRYISSQHLQVISGTRDVNGLDHVNHQNRQIKEACDLNAAFVFTTGWTHTQINVYNIIIKVGVGSGVGIFNERR